MPTLNFKLVTPERVVLEQELTSLVCPTTMGQITILPHHIPLVANLVPGELIARVGKDEFYEYVAGGILQVQQGNTVVVLADAAEHVHEIDAQLAEEAQKRAAIAARETRLSDEEYAKVMASLERSMARLKIVRKRASKKSPLTSTGVFSE